MSLYLRKILVGSVAGILAGSVMAADGVINFTGEIVAASCKTTGGAGTNITGAKGAQIVDVNLGKVSIDTLSSTAGGGVVGGSNIRLELDCGGTAGGLSTVKLKFDPYSGSGVNPKNNSLLKVTGTATGVGIGIYDTTNKLLNLSANETIDAPLSKSGDDTDVKYTARLDLRASYVASGEAIKAGTANGTLPFTLTYE